MEYKCPNCKSTKMIVQSHPNKPKMVGLYCADCGRWIKWLGKQEQQDYAVPQNPAGKNKNSIPYDVVVKFIRELHTLANKSRIFKNTGDRYIMTQDLLGILGNFTFKNDITFKK